MAIAPPDPGTVDLHPGEALAWAPRGGRAPFRVWSFPPRAERRRHARKYAEADLSPDQSFYFRGPAGRLSLRAQNLRLFLQIADGVDEETWLHHLGRGDYSAWILQAIKDARLAHEIAAIERSAVHTTRPSAAETRARVRAAIEARYTAAP